MAYTVNIVHAFVDDDRGGNPAGVVLNADGLSPSAKAHIARQIGLSETAFVSASDVADVKLEFFTPTRQIPHCGHATIATFGLLAQRGMLTGDAASKETIDGTRRIRMRDDAAFMEQLAPTYTGEDRFPSGVTTDRILASLGLAARDVLAPPCAVATGNRFLLIHVRSVDILRRIHPDLGEVGRIGEALEAVGYYVFAQDGDEFDATTRMFAPHYGIDEEAATGMAAGPLACYLHDRIGLAKTNILIRQGVYMREPSPSRIAVELNVTDGKIVSLFAGGRARVVSSVDIQLQGQG